MDLIIATIIFIAGIVVFYFYALNSTKEPEEIINRLNYEGNIITNEILSEGFPANWNELNAISIGITSANKINDTKLEKFYEFSLNNYNRTKLLFNTRYNYYIYLSEENFTINSQNIEGIGLKSVDSRRIIKISRVTIYNNKLITINVEVWE